MADAAAPVLPEPESPAADEQPVEVAEVIEVPAPPLQPEPGIVQHLPAVIDHALIPGRDVSIIPAQEEMRGLAAMAVTLAGANAVPAPLRNAPNDVFQVLLTARDLGVAVTTAMREFHVIDGRVTLSPKVKLAMVHERGQREGWKVWPCSIEMDDQGERQPCRYCGSETGNTAERAAWHATRADHPGSVFTSEFTMEMAQRVKINSAGKTLAQKENWQGYPQRMLSWRALGFLLDDVFPEVGTGLYSPDELGAMTDEDGSVIDVASTEPLPGTKPPRGHRSKDQPPDPRDLPLIETDPDAHAALKHRVHQLTSSGDGPRQALLELWTKKDENEQPTLPTIDRLLGRDVRKAEAMLKSVEARVAKGEWPDVTPPAEGDEQTPEGAVPPTPDDRGDGDAEAQPPVSDDERPRCETCGAPEGAEHLPELHELADVADQARGTQGVLVTEPPTRESIEKATLAEVTALDGATILARLEPLLAEGEAMPRGKQERLNRLVDVLVEQRVAELG